MLWKKSHSEVSKYENSEIIKSNAILVLCISIFALGFPAAEFLLDDWDVVTVIAVRNVFAFVLLFIIWIALEGSGVLRTANWTKGFWIGGIGFGIGSFLLLFVQSIISPILIFFIDKKYVKGLFKYYVLLVILTPMHWPFFKGECLSTIIAKKWEILKKQQQHRLFLKNI